MSTIDDWFSVAPQPICWIRAANAAAVRATLANRAHDTVSLSSANSDYCLQQLIHEASEPVTTAQLFAHFPIDEERLLLIDGLDTVQELDRGQITDLRLRHFLAAVAAGRWPRLRVIATSRLPVPVELHAATSVIDYDEQPESPLPCDAVPSLSGDDLIEQTISKHIRAGEIEEAVMVYWESLGSFSRLGRENALHRGARICRMLNGGRRPQEISPALRRSPGALAVLNDWALFAECVGDARLATEAAEAAYAMMTKDRPPWEWSALARQVAKAQLSRGLVPDALRWGQRAVQHAREGMRLNEGVPSQEAMGAYDEGYTVQLEATVAMYGAGGAAAVLEDLAEIHEIAREQLARFNRASIVAVPGPTGPVDGETLADGYVAALVALVEGRASDAGRIVEKRLARLRVEGLSRWKELDLWLLRLRAIVADGDYGQARSSIEQLQRSANAIDDTAARCDLALRAVEVALFDQDIGTAISLVDEALLLAANGGLGLLWIDLLTLRSRALLAVGRNEEAQAAANAALFGPDGETVERWTAAADLLGALHIDCGYHTGARAAAVVLQAAGGAIPDGVLQDPKPMERPKKRRRRKPIEETRATGEERRVQLHEAALAAIDAYNERGVPFALYFRKFDFLIGHGPMEFGPQLVENALRDAMLPNANVVTIQSHDDSIEYAGSGFTFDRSAPALLLDDEYWQTTVEALIPFADMIVSECLMVSPGVQFELDTAFRFGRWDRTVLVLPPLRSPFAVVDSDPLIQMFPRAVWADSFHTKPFVEAPVASDLIARIEAIAALSDDERRRLVDRNARDAAYPIDLLPIAERYELEALLDTFRPDEDDRIRYYAFWRLFRAAAIRSVRLRDGDDSLDNRTALNDAYVQMAAIQLDHERESDHFVLIGDLDFAEKCAQSAYNLIRESDGPFAVTLLRDRAEKQWQSVLRLRDAVAAQPDRFVLRPRYGPFVTAPLPDVTA